eukprot:1613753-Rhodomonas_salina.1
MADDDAVAVQIEGLFEHIMMDGLGNVQQMMLASESVANSGERVMQATCGGVSVGADVGGAQTQLLVRLLLTVTA